MDEGSKLNLVVGISLARRRKKSSTAPDCVPSVAYVHACPVERILNICFTYIHMYLLKWIHVEGLVKLLRHF